MTFPLEDSPFSFVFPHEEFADKLFHTRLCPLLNGTIKQEDGFNNAAFMGAPPTMP